MKKRIEIMAEMPPDYTQRYVIWHANEPQTAPPGVSHTTTTEGGQLIVLVGYCPDTLAWFAGMFADMQAACPDVNAERAICTKVRESSCRKGFTLLLADIKGEPRDIPGFKPTTWRSLDIRGY